MTLQFSSFVKKTLNSFCFSILTSAFAIIKHYNSANDILMLIEESFKSEVGNCIDYANGILKTRKEM